MIILMENRTAGTYEEMQSISCAFAVMAVLFLAAGTASFFINKIYHSINVILYFLRRSGESFCRGNSGSAKSFCSKP